MYANINQKFTMGTEKWLMNYTNGVFQGDNASLFLFLIQMTAATDSFQPAF